MKSMSISLGLFFFWLVTESDKVSLHDFLLRNGWRKVSRFRYENRNE